MSGSGMKEDRQARSGIYVKRLWKPEDVGDQAGKFGHEATASGGEYAEGAKNFVEGATSGVEL